MSLLLRQVPVPYQQQGLHCPAQRSLEPPDLHCSNCQVAAAAASLGKLLLQTVLQLLQLLGWVLQWEQAQPC
jgi:hypothetical protein